MTMALLVMMPKLPAVFRELAQLRKGFNSLKYLMLLSNIYPWACRDFEVTIQEGADLVRIGSSIFNAAEII